MLKILQARLQQYMNQELPDIQAGFRKGRGTKDQIANIRWVIKKSKRVPKIYLFLDYAKAFDCVDHNNLWKIIQEMGIPEHLTCFLRNLYAGWEDAPEKGMAPHFSNLDWGIPWMCSPWGCKESAGLSDLDFHFQIYFHFNIK